MYATIDVDSSLFTWKNSGANLFKLFNRAMLRFGTDYNTAFDPNEYIKTTYDPRVLSDESSQQLIKNYLQTYLDFWIEIFQKGASVL